jgi:two-component system response regulator HydG
VRWFAAANCPEHPLFGDVITRALGAGEPALCADLALDPSLPSTPAGQLFASAAAVAVGFGPGGQAWLYADTLGSNRALTADDLPALEALARLLGGVVLRCRRERSQGRQADRVLAEVRAQRQFLGKAPSVRALLRQVERLAASRTTVLLCGETGTGKEILARLVHDHGPNPRAPFLAVNCAALPEALAESLLFGHVKGAFTGAERSSAGLFRDAQDGTLFLDEVAELPLTVQAKLLRVLENREVLPIGASTPEKCAARIVAATHRDLRVEVHAGRFRADVAFRLQVVTLDIPPLRDRGDDIRLLAQWFLDRANAEHGRRRVLADSAWPALRQHPWPGNVRELQHAIEGAVLLADHDTITAADLALRVPQAESRQPEMLALSEVEQQHILHVLSQVGANKSKAARVLGLDRSTLYEKLKLYGAGD